MLFRMSRIFNLALQLAKLYEAISRKGAITFEFKIICT